MKCNLKASKRQGAMRKEQLCEKKREAGSDKGEKRPKSVM
jgi:hypothetical protein